MINFDDMHILQQKERILNVKDFFVELKHSDDKKFSLIFCCDREKKEKQLDKIYLHVGW